MVASFHFTLYFSFKNVLYLVKYTWYCECVEAERVLFSSELAAAAISRGVGEEGGCPE